MGRPPTPWLDAAFRMLAGGEWLRRDDVLATMVKLVPPGMAYRRGEATKKRSPVTAPEELIRRGARHICLTALSGRPQIQSVTRSGVIFIRLQTEAPAEVPLMLQLVDGDLATHVLVPVEVWRGEESLDEDELRWVRER